MLLYANTQQKLRITVYSDNYPMAVKDFAIDIIDYCEPESIDILEMFTPANLDYMIGESMSISTFTPLWTTVPTICNINFAMTITPEPIDPNLITLDD